MSISKWPAVLLCRRTRTHKPIKKRRPKLRRTRSASSIAFLLGAIGHVLSFLKTWPCCKISQLGGDKARSAQAHFLIDPRGTITHENRIDKAACLVRGFTRQS